jgi:hypothetical protein
MQDLEADLMKEKERNDDLQGSILQNSVSVEAFTDAFSSSYFGQNST